MSAHLRRVGPVDRVDVVADDAGRQRVGAGRERVAAERSCHGPDNVAADQGEGGSRSLQTQVRRPAPDQVDEGTHPNERRGAVRGGEHEEPPRLDDPDDLVEECPRAGYVLEDVQSAGSREAALGQIGAVAEVRNEETLLLREEHLRRVGAYGREAGLARSRRVLVPTPQPTSSTLLPESNRCVKWAT